MSPPVPVLKAADQKMGFLLTPCAALDMALIKQQRLVNQSPSLGISSRPCAPTLSYKQSDIDSCRKRELETLLQALQRLHILQ